MTDVILLGKELITEFLTEIQKELIAYMQAENRNATGLSAASIQVVNVTNSAGQLVGSQAIEYVFRGRGPGRFPPLSAIIDWCNARGLPRGIAWVIAKRIAENGTKLHQQGRNVLQEIITEEKITQFKAQILITFTSQIDSDIKNLIAA